MFKKLKKLLNNKKGENIIYSIKSDFLNDFIKLSVFKNEEKIDIFDYDNDIYNFFLNSDLFIVSENNSYIELDYNNVYEIEEEYFEFFNLPQYFNGYIKIENSANFLNKNGMKFEYFFYDSSKELKIFNKNILRDRNNKYLIYKEQYELIKTIDKYNNGENILIPSEQYKLLNSIKKASEETNIILNETLRKKETVEIIDNIMIDFVKNEEGLYELLPVCENFSEDEIAELQTEFKKRNVGKDFYTINLKGKQTQIVFNTNLKKDINQIKKKPLITESELINRDFPLEVSEHIEFKFGERFKGLGFLNYRPSPPLNTSDIDWFSKDFPCMFHDEGNIQLTPDNLNYLENKLSIMGEENDKTILEFENNDGNINKIEINKENLSNEISKLKNSMIDFSKIKSISILETIIKKMNVSDNEYIAYEGKYIKNEKNTTLISEYLESLKEENRIKEEKPKKQSILIKDNLETLEYIEEIEENLEVIKEIVEIPVSLRKEYSLYDYQKEGLLKLQSLYKKSNINGLLLCDDMGLGKTFQILLFLAWLKESNIGTPSLIILPTSLIHNWIDEINKFFVENTFSCAVLQGIEKEEIINDYINKDIVLTSYESLRINHIKTGKIKWKVLVCDEAQKIKNPRTLVTTAVKSQNVEFKIACSATPIENSIEDLWCLTDFVKPGLLNSLKEFRKEYSNNKKLSETDLKNQNEELKEKLDDFYIRRTKDEVLKDKNFPKKIIKYQQVQISKKQMEVLDNFYKQRDDGQKVLPLIQGMLMNCSHPRLINLDDTNINFIKEVKLLEEAFKLESLKKILDSIEQKREKAIIFTKYRKMQKILTKIVRYWFGFIPNRINGDYDSNARRNILKEFSDSIGFNILILSPEAAGVGLNIVSANHVIHYTRHWNPAKEEQATDRAYRIGQTKDVYVYYPVVSFDNENIKETTFYSQNEWIDTHINLDVTDKTPEEKLNKIIIRKKQLLRDFFFSAIPEMEELDKRDFISKKGDNEFINITNIFSFIDHRKFEILSTMLIEREYNGEGYVTIQSGDHGIDGVVISNKEKILIQAKQFKNKVGNQARNDLIGGKDVYENALGVKFDKLILITTSDNTSQSLNEYSKNDLIEIIDRPKLAKLLQKYKFSYNDICIRDSDRKYSLEMLRAVLC